MLQKNTSRQRPTLPRPDGRSTIGAEGLNCRVRNGNGCFPLARVTGKLEFKERSKPGSRAGIESNVPRNVRPPTGGKQPNRLRELATRIAGQRIRTMVKPNDRLVRVSSRPRSPYTSRLSTWSSPRGLRGDLIFRGASRLDAFSVYPFRT